MMLQPMGCATRPRLGARRASARHFLRSLKVAAGVAPSVSAASASRTATSTTYNVKVFTNTPRNGSEDTDVELVIVGAESGLKRAPFTLNTFERLPWTRENDTDADNPLLPARIRAGTIEVDSEVGTPGAILVTKGLKTLGREALDYISRIELEAQDGSGTITFPAATWVSSDQPKRVIFAGAASVPSKSPPGLEELRKRDLSELRGDVRYADRKDGDPRSGSDRIYEYDIYDDLGPLPPKKELTDLLLDLLRPKEEFVPRQPLGNSDEFPYPRRIRTGREKKVEGGRGYEEFTTNPWLPKDEEFNFTKTVGFFGGAASAALPSLAAQLREALDGNPDDHFASLADLEALYTDGDAAEVQKVLKGGDINNLTDDLRKDLVPPEVAQLFPNLAFVGNVIGNVFDSLESVSNPVQAFQELVHYPIPKVIEGRPEAWYQDKEFGRQMLAGQHTCVLEVATRLPDGCTINDNHVAKLLPQGSSLASLFTEAAGGGAPRLFWVEYWDVYKDYIDPVMASAQKQLTKQQASSDKFKVGRALHAGRCLLLLDDDGYLVPIAIELSSKQGGADPHVYTPDADKTPENLWLLAKLVFASLDSLYHQVYSHFVRAHAATEPYIIATHRQLSALHPVYKMLQPHFRYNLNINSKARGTLINAGGVIEASFTPGPLTMEMSSKMYGKAWTFEGQALPQDLKTRGLLDDQGDLRIKDYPYAQDGLLIWDALESYFTEYLGIYYKSDAEIQDDEELRAWWEEIQQKGHPDIETGWPTLDGVASLARISTTMAWTASAHHAAINFGQYDYSGYILNRSPLVSKPMPVPGTAEAADIADTDRKDIDAAAAKLLQYLAGPAGATSVMTTVKLLSNHALNEEYLTTRRQEWLSDPAAVKAFENFWQSIEKVEEEIKRRNQDPNSRTRSVGHQGLPYTLLLPSSGPGVTGRGVPCSVSI